MKLYINDHTVFRVLTYIAYFYRLTPRVWGPSIYKEKPSILVYVNLTCTTRVINLFMLSTVFLCSLSVDTLHKSVESLCKQKT